VDRAAADALLVGAVGGKSGLHRTWWWVTPTGREARESATESKPPDRGFALMG
jgi:hypothetical protein